MYPVAERFVSINGEGTKAGQLAVFIRFRGCNLNCRYCDTKWANQTDTQYTSMSAEEIISYIEETGVTNVTLTGGEPLMQEHMRELLEKIGKKKWYVEIETNGSVPLEKYAEMSNRPSFTMDYKMACSGMEEYMCMENFSVLDARDTVKFVVGSMADLERAREVIAEYRLVGRCHVYISPVFGEIEPADIVEYMKAHCMNGVNLQIQMHKVIWDPQERGV
ncbi:MAG: putative 7-carboxy-7-deazaguanine synthase QueE [Clostridia bacterium]|nr:putative 7-carboxy-7-deazaguanine synthase QueE [Clostridia bacterium]NCC42977.1 putative 7-carboxy-7-deazaguanine synthase QueE [Clostridia bacterium]